MTNKLAVFDFDSTLMDGETLEFFARELGIEEKVKAITDRAMRGEADFFESLTERVALLKGLPLTKVDEICHNLPIMNGAEEVVKGLKEKGYKVVCFSGGFRTATTHFAKKLGLDGEFANILHSKDGVLTGQVGGEMMFNDSKGKMLLRLQKLLDVTKENTIAVGDGANDLSMFKYAGIRVAFCAKPIVKENADIVINEKDLRKILDYID
jgi:phosphoserine phosphatase